MQKPNQDMQKPIITKRKALQNLNAALGEQDLIIPSSLPPLPLLPAERSTRALKPSALKMAKLKPSAFLDSLKRKLPVKLSSWIEGNKPKNIYQIQIASPGKDTGFNTFSWQDDDGSKLYLQNLNSSGVIYERFKVTYPEDQRLAVTLQTALSTYKKMLSAGVDNGFRVEEVAATKGAAKRKQASDMFQAIKEAALSLQNTVNTEIENQKRTGLKKSDIAILS